MSERYKYIVTPNKVIVLTKYAGRPVRGIAKCSPKDNFDEGIGKELAQLRCDIKVAKLRMKRAHSKYEQASTEWLRADNHLADMEDYYYNACDEYQNLLAEQEELLEKL